MSKHLSIIHNEEGSLLVVDADRRLIGALNMHDLLRAGVV